MSLHPDNLHGIFFEAYAVWDSLQVPETEAEVIAAFAEYQRRDNPAGATEAITRFSGTVCWRRTGRGEPCRS